MRISSITKNAGKACNNRLYRHIRTFEKIVKNYFVIYNKTERENIKQRQKEGIAAAKLRGVRFGRPRKPVPVNFDSLRAAWNKGDISSRQAAAQLGIAQDTFLRWAHGK